MALNIDRFKKDFENLRHRGMLLEIAMLKQVSGAKDLRSQLSEVNDQQYQEIINKLPVFDYEYEAWYSECIALLKQILPDRLDSFKKQYEIQKGRKSISFDNYVIEDYMIGLQVTLGVEVRADRSAAVPKMRNQRAILDAAGRRFESSLFEIRQIVQADLFDTEIESARHLLDNKFVRAAGAVAGVVLEKHLLQVCADHCVKISKKNPGIGDLNQALRDAGVIDIPQWRHITLMGDYRNLCDHKKTKDPTEEQVGELLDGTDKILKTIA